MADRFDPFREKLIEFAEASLRHNDNSGCEVTINMGTKSTPVAYKLSPTEPKWIPVTERLPELHGDFITAIAFEDGDILIDISVWYGKCWETLSGEKCNVTHWMPLPEPPKEVE